MVRKVKEVVLLAKELDEMLLKQMMWKKRLVSFCNDLDQSTMSVCCYCCCFHQSLIASFRFAFADDSFRCS